MRIIIPRSTIDPTGLDSLERSAMREFTKRINECIREYAGFVEKLPASEIIVSRYEFQITAETLQTQIDAVNDILDRILVGPGPQSNWFINAFVEPSYARGTARSMTNISAQSTEYARSRQTLESILQSPTYQRRISFVRQRNFEEMRGMSDEAKTRLARVLGDGMARGKNPRDIARAIMDDVPDMLEGRAHRIARTEIPLAFKRARREESQQAMDDFGFRILMAHVSAMTSTTREWHARRNGELHTIEEQEEWYSVDGNAYNCKCSEVETLVNAKGEPLAPGALEALRKRKLVYKGMEKEDE